MTVGALEYPIGSFENPRKVSNDEAAQIKTENAIGIVVSDFDSTLFKAAEMGLSRDQIGQCVSHVIGTYIRNDNRMDII